MKKIAVLRGINVGGKRKILMADLKKLCAEIELNHVQTYIQSGNIIFESQQRNDKIERLLTKSIKEKFNFDVPVIVRDAKSLQPLIAQNPFLTTTDDIKQLLVTFLKDIPSDVDVSHLETFRNNLSDDFVVKENIVFLHCKENYHTSKLTNNFFEKHLHTTATTRNWKTVSKLIDLSKNENNV